MARAEAPRERIGEMLVSLGLITRTQLEHALEQQKQSGLPIGKQLVALGSVSETRLTQVLSNQLSVPWVSLERVEFPAELLQRIPGELADRRCILPIYVRNVRGRGATLYVAMDDPTDDEALREVSTFAAMPVRPMIAPPSELRRAIEQRYFGAPVRKNKPSERSLRAANTNGNPALPERAKLPRKSNRAAAPSPPAKKPPPPPGPKRAEHPEEIVAVERYEAPSQPPPASAAAARTLTLLDGTTIKLPGGKAARDSQEVRAVRHVVKAVRSARSKGEQPEEAMRWHDIVQTLLDALELRGVRLTRAEIAQAWTQHRAKRDESKVRKG